MLRISRKLLLIALLTFGLRIGAQPVYVPSDENLQARKEFSDARFGIFLHWGLYSMFAQGEWYMQNAGIPLSEYSKSASAFYPHLFDADKWVSAIKDAGAGYICFTSRHHEGFSMWKTDESDFNIVDATPFKRDVVKELADACHAKDMRLHLYYSHIDWGREDYPMGKSGQKCGKNVHKADWPHYYKFMNNQLTELLTRYGKIGAIWFDGWWDHEKDSVPFDWQLTEQYELIHRLQPACLIGNNHHMTINQGEDLQIFERDLPGENKAGFVDRAADISRLPLETCETMNGMWGYKIVDQDYKSVAELVRLLVNTAGKGANLLLNIGPQPNGELPEVALDRLKGIGEWMRQYGNTIRGTEAGDIPVQKWGATTRKGNHLFVHITDRTSNELSLPLTCKVRRAVMYGTDVQVKFRKTKKGILLQLPEKDECIDLIIDLETE